MEPQHFVQQMRQLALLAGRQPFGHEVAVSGGLGQGNLLDHCDARRGQAQAPSAPVLGRAIALDPALSQSAAYQVTAGVGVQADEVSNLFLRSMGLLGDGHQQCQLPRRHGRAVVLGKASLGVEMRPAQQVWQMPGEVEIGGLQGWLGLVRRGLFRVWVGTWVGVWYHGFGLAPRVQA